MKIGIIGAMPEEVDKLKKDMLIEKTDKIAMREYHSGTLYGKEAVLVFSKCGKVSAASAAVVLIERYKVDMIVFTGVAGAADKDLKIGDIVVGRKLVQHDMDASGIPAFKKFEIPLLGISYFEADARLFQLALHCARKYVKNSFEQEAGIDERKAFHIFLPAVVPGTIASGDRFICDRNVICRMRNDIEDLKCVEMEGAAVAQVCHEYSLPCVVLRVISDNADEHAPVNFQRFINNVASLMTRGVVREILASL